MAYDEGFCSFAAQSLQKRLEALTREIEGVREAEDIEFVHRMRVASRRLRSALSLFRECFPKKRFGLWRSGMRAITRALGDARDLDVQIDFLKGYLEGLESGRLKRGPERLILRLRQRREQAQGPVQKALDEFAGSGIAEDMGKWLKSLQKGGKSRGADFRTPGVYARAREAITERMTEVLGFEACVDQPENKEDLHAMRIANKRLRYVMEIFGPLYDDGLKEDLSTIREFHTQLGDIHDCDVWEEFFPVFLEEERRRTEEFFGHSRFFSRIESGILVLAQNRLSFRRERYETFRDLFHRTRKEGFWEKLGRRLEEPLSQIGNREKDRRCG